MTKNIYKRVTTDQVKTWVSKSNGAAEFYRILCKNYIPNFKQVLDIKKGGLTFSQVLYKKIITCMLNNQDSDITTVEDWIDMTLDEVEPLEQGGCHIGINEDFIIYMKEIKGTITTHIESSYVIRKSEFIYYVNNPQSFINEINDAWDSLSPSEYIKIILKEE